MKKKRKDMKYLNTFCIVSCLLLLSSCSNDERSSTRDSATQEAVVVEIPTSVTAAVTKEFLSRIEINKAQVDPAASQVFRAPIYRVEPLLEYISVVDGEILDLNYQGSSSVLSGYLKLIRDDFVLDSEEKAKLLGKAFQHEFPYKRSDGGKFIQPVKLDKGWLLIRNEFFKNHSGLVFTTDEKGKITLVEYILKINPEDYSYKAPTASYNKTGY